MKYSYLWLKELSGTKKNPKQLAELLGMHSFEFEGMKTEGKETQLEFSILPNRGHDALSHIGLAREICACEGRKFKELGVSKINPKPGLKAEIRDRKLCSRYIGAVIEDVKIGPSPKWLVDRLLASGVKPINNIVDITNYVMLETGQPLHAFDKSKVKSQKSNGIIIVRKAKKGEKLKLLDENVYELNENDLVIADSEKALALAGVMGGYDSSIKGSTTSIILESANFDAASVRKTRMRHNIITESSHRFERQIDPNLAEIGAMRAVDLIRKICDRGGNITARADIYPKKVNPWRIKLDADYANKLLGEDVPVAKMKKILENLGIGVSISGKFLNCEIPTRRIDLKTQEDLIEEVGRLYGYENIKEQPLIAEVKMPSENKKRDFESKMRDIMAGLGFSEVMNYSFYGNDDIQKCNLKIDDHVEVANPLSLDQQYLRRSLAPNILKNIELNLKNFPEVRIFEIGNKFCNDAGNFSEGAVLFGAMTDNSAKVGLFFELKGCLEAFLKKANVGEIIYERVNAEYKFWNPARAAKIMHKGKKIGRIGEIHPRVLAKYGIKQRVAVFGIKITALMEARIEKREYAEIDRYPSAERDISMFVEKETKYSEIEKNVKKSGGIFIKGIELFDIFEKEEKKSLALRMKIGSNSKTLTSGEVDSIMEKITSSLEKDLKVSIRK